MKKLIILLVSTLLAACGTTPMNYSPKKISINDANETVERLIMTQHRNWRPDYFVITDKYFGWDYGSVQSGRSSGAVYNNVLVASSQSTVRDVNERVYYLDVTNVQLYDWTRKFKQWYTVGLLDKNGNVIKHVLRTRDLEDAELMVDSLNTILAEHQIN
ncbi:hypothetical protein D2H34_003531 [Vibrio fluvialis]|uniref:hypothetical protein n=1 Tax=Vibrio fluvialis TaxID=676 RepID=UPI000462E08D|nr:hypothetical protein [Vibrio fluvialis]EKO3466469.1 hypothetical protein [Vibrio fluvialis]EKO3514127.1 hypothetical protein [Vibrio fluvialis]EKO3555117.1 hypothetical protein [Vibrio fluvialis]EKO5149259.1 hypothetical protein [Vibrio fluvialis]ELG2962729.1 hypothetical protein [Vibrio fluvialis]